jgi:hypothetical protein
MYKNINWINYLLSGSIAISLASISFASKAVKAPDGTVAFESGIDLVDAHTTFSGVRVRQARYYFDLELPEDLGEPLKKVVIHQRSGSDKVRFKPDKTTAFLGNHHNKQEPLALKAFTDEATEEITVEFDRPIPPGSSVTIGIKPSRNPDYGGVYLFGVTAYPPGEKSVGLYLGPGRLQFYRGNDFYH